MFLFLGEIAEALVVGSEELAYVIVGVDGVRRTSMRITIEQLEQVAENLGAVAAINFLDYKIVGIVEVRPCSHIGF